MTTHDESHAGDALFEAFVEQVKQVLEHLYDFAYLQQHPLARIYDHEGDLSAKTAGRQLRADVIRVIESLKPPSEATFRAPVARLYNMLHLYYVENLSIQDAALELGLSERQAYRDLKRGQESIAAVLWDKRLPQPQSAQVNNPPQDFSFETEIARLKLNFSAVDIRQLFHSAQDAVKRLSEQRSVEIVAEEVASPLMISTDSGIAQQILVSLLSYAIQQAEAGILEVSFRSPHRGTVTLALHYTHTEEGSVSMSPVIATLVHRLRWHIVQEDLTAQTRQIVLDMTSSKATILVIDDNEGWTELLGRFLEGSDCVVIAGSADQDVVQQVRDLLPTLIILDVMMPGRDGWELLQRLRAQPSTSDIPIMVCTVFHDSQLAYSLGASAFVSKPAGREIILETLETLGVL
jgi:CheY-like chemotaxis protein